MGKKKPEEGGLAVWKERLEALMANKHIQYYFDLSKCKPATRHEAFWLVNSVSNIVLIEEIEGLRKDVRSLKNLLNKRTK